MDIVAIIGILASGGVIGAVITAMVQVFGSKEVREASSVNAAGQWQELYEATKLENKELKLEITSLTTQVSQLMSRVVELEKKQCEHDSIPPTPNQTGEGFYSNFDDSKKQLSKNSSCDVTSSHSKTIKK